MVHQLEQSIELSLRICRLVSAGRWDAIHYHHLSNLLIISSFSEFPVYTIDYDFHADIKIHSQIFSKILCEIIKWIYINFFAKWIHHN